MVPRHKWGALDVGRRYGDDDQFGVRVNVLHREGETAIKDEKIG